MSDDDNTPTGPSDRPARTAKKTARKPRKRAAARPSQTTAIDDTTAAEPASSAPADARVEPLPSGAGDNAAMQRPKRKARGKSRADHAPIRAESAKAPPAAEAEAPTDVSAVPVADGSPTTVPRRLLLSTQLDVRWGDMDAFNHVNNAVFLSYLEEARLRWLQGLSGPWLDDNTAPLLAAAHVDYRRPIEWPCTLAIELYADRVGTSSLTLGHRIVDAGDATVVFSEGHTVMVWIDRRNGKGSVLPAAVREACSGAERPVNPPL